MRNILRILLLISAGIAITLSPLRCFAATDADTELAKQAQNPVAKLISVQLQNNFNFGFGPDHHVQCVFNIQPVIPISLGPEWNLITRTIMPIFNQDAPSQGMDIDFKLGDINPTFFLSPASSGEFIWGIGPTFTLPTATHSMLESGKWSAGPAVVALTMQGPLVVGVLANTQWSFAGWGNKFFTQSLIQPFINYNFEHGLYLTSSPIITCNWEANGGNRWMLPLGAGVGKIFHLWRLPINTQLTVYYNVVTPDNAPSWQLRFEVQLLFPK